MGHTQKVLVVAAKHLLSTYSLDKTPIDEIAKSIRVLYETTCDRLAGTENLRKSQRSIARKEVEARLEEINAWIILYEENSR